MHLHNQIPVGIRHVLKADIPKDASIIDQNINPTKSFYGRIDDCLAMLDTIVICNGVAAF